MIESTKEYIVLFILLPDKKTFLINIPHDHFSIMESSMKNDPQKNMLNPYPFGDFEKILTRDRPIGCRPIFELEMSFFMVPAGVVLEVIDHICGDTARSKAISRSAFKPSSIVEI
jgi:hypothetical protein